MTPSAERLDLWLADFYLLSSILLLVVIAALRIVEQPVRRLAVEKSAIVALVVLALLTALPGWSIVHFWTRSQSAAAAVPANQSLQTDQLATLQQVTPPNAGSPIAPTSTVVPKVTVAPRHESRFSQTIALTFLSGSACVFAWLTAGMLAARRLIRTCQPAPPQITAMLAASGTVAQRWSATRGLPELLASSRIPVPVALGIRRPTIILPSRWLDDRTPGDLRTILAHEAAHIQNGDLRWLAVGRALLVLLWAQPLYWLLRRQLRLDQEILADAAAADVAGRHEYAEQLVAWAANVPAPTRLALPAAIGLWEGPSQLRRRIALLLNDRLTILRNCPRPWRLGAAALAISTAAALSLITLQPASNAADDTPTTAKSLRHDNDRSGAVTYTGAAVDKQTGQPIADAKVNVRIYDATTRVQPWKTVVGTVVNTDASGRFKFEVPREMLNNQFVDCRFAFTHPDYAPHEAQPTTKDIAQQAETRTDGLSFKPVELERGEVVTGIVNKPDGSPAANLRVLTYSEVDSKQGEFGECKTDENGRFRFAAAPGGSAVFWLLPKDFAAQTQAIDRRRGDLGVFQLEKGIRLGGRVVDQQGWPLANLWVNAVLVDGAARKPIERLIAADQIDRSALTDGDGHFELGPLPPSTYRVVPDELPEESDEILETPHPLKNAFLPIRVTLRSDAMNPPIEFRAVEPVTVTAQFIDSKGKATRGYGFFLKSTTPEGQHYASRRYPNQADKVVFLVPKGLTNTYIDLPISSVRQRIASDKPLSKNYSFYLDRLDHDWPDITIVRYQAPVLTVDPVDTDGKRLANAKVVAEYASVDQTGTSYLSPAEQLYFDRQTDGRWRSDSTVPDEDFRVTLSADGYQPVSQTVSLKEGETKELSITLAKNDKPAGDQSSNNQAGPNSPPLNTSVQDRPEPNTISGRITDKNGKPLAHALIRVAVPATDMRFVLSSSEHKVYEAVTGDDGRYKLEIPTKDGATTATIDAMAPGYRRLSGALRSGGDARQLTISPGSAAEASFALEPALDVKGVVIDEAGKPIAGAEIDANGNTSRSSGGIERTTSNQDGSFEIFNFPLAPASDEHETEKGVVSVFHPDYVRASLDDVYALSADEQKSLRIVLPTGYTVTGVVLDTEQKPVANIMVEAAKEETGKSSDRKATTTDAAGKYTLRGLPQALITFRAHDMKRHERVVVPIAVNTDSPDSKLFLQPVSLKSEPQKVNVLGMTLTDLTPELRGIYDVYSEHGALILDPGKNSARLGAGELAEGYCFIMAGDYKPIVDVRGFLETVIADSETSFAHQYGCRVVYTCRTLEFVGTNTQYLKLTDADLRELRETLAKLPRE
jgi:beta-lactamase regulating signal transducer with metallopeptidase domain/protocatechuate 3,4-dioxygenase beta subunit/5-hydroxyisourate hydrolase-like protein (transthyretin family)